MRFEDFARQYGLIIDSLIPFKWMATPTEDHPRKRNGRYKFMGDIGWVQNWATMEKPVMWKTDQENSLSPNFLRQRQNFKDEQQKSADKASSKAQWILSHCVNSTHEYLKEKGFPDEEVNVWKTDSGDELLVIPMSRDKTLVGCQLIDTQGNKKFLYGQQTKGASFKIGAKGIPIFCEGFATGLSIRTIMQLNKVPYTIYICFSAGNMQEIAGSIPNGFIVADNDPSGVGERIAKETGKAYWLSDTVGEDFNDYHQRVGLFKASQSLKKLFIAK